MSYPIVVNFTTDDAGSTIGTSVAAADNPLIAGAQLSINGSTDLSAIVVGNSGAFVETMFLEDSSGFFPYELSIYGQGPAGAGSGSLVITIIDGAGGSHWIKLNSSTYGHHALGFSTSMPTINTISWAPGDV